jgi:glycosidase
MKHCADSSIFYHIYPLGFCDAPFKNDFTSPPVSRLDKIYSWIDHIKDLGINALYLGPLFESTAHGYDTADYYWVDRRLGTNDTLKNLVSYLHSKNIRVILDGVFNHTGRDFWAFRDVLSNGAGSRYCGWFQNLQFNDRSPLGDPFTYEGWNGHYDLVKLNLRNSEVKDHLLNAVRTWISEFDIDGLRLDAADCIDMDFLKELAGFSKSIKEDFWLTGEIIHGDYRKWANSNTLDSVTNYECYKSLYSSYNDKNFYEIAYALNRQFGESGLYKSLPLYNFVDNHDVTRIGSQLKNPAHLYPLYFMLFTIPGVPSIYYGSEWGIKGIKIKGSDYPLRPSLDLDLCSRDNHKDLPEAIKKLSKIRQKSKALQYGNYRQLFLNHEQLAFMRQYNNETVIVIVNSSADKTVLDINVPLPDGTILTDILNDEEKIKVTGNKIKVDPLWGTWGRVLLCNH